MALRVPHQAGMASVSGGAALRWFLGSRSASRLACGRKNIFGPKSWDPISPGSIIFLQPQRTYRAAVCTELKKPLVVRDVPSAVLQPHEVRIRVRCCGVNFADILACQGLYQEQHSLPLTPGMEYSGDVMETGKAVTNIKEMCSYFMARGGKGQFFSSSWFSDDAFGQGDCVIGVTKRKALAEEYIADPKLLWKIPQGVPYEAAAALPTSYGTAILALKRRAQTRPGETVLVTAAAGATGLAVVDVAANVLKAKVIAAAGSDSKRSLAIQKGAVESVNYSGASLREEVKKLTANKGVDVVIDTVGGDIFKQALHSLAFEGRIVVVGFAGGTIPSIEANILLLKNISALGLFWGRYRDEEFPVFSATISSALSYYQDGKIQPHIGRVFKLEEVNEAFAHVTQRKSTGKIIISIH